MATGGTNFPKHVPFIFMGFQWKVYFIDIDSNDFGETDTDKKEIRIYYGGRSRQNVIETLIHELVHVVLFDTSDSIFHYDEDSLYKKEENAVRLTSPRIFSILIDNEILMNFITRQIKLVKKERS